METPIPAMEDPAAAALPEAVLSFIYGEAGDPSAESALQVIQSNGEGLKDLALTNNIHHPAHFAWSPDGQWIAVRAGPTQDRYSDILLVSA